MTQNVKRFIVDRNVIQAASYEDKDVFKQFCDQGNKLVLLETLIQEIANAEYDNDTRFGFESFIKKRGFQELNDNIEIWEPSSKLLKFEVSNQRPITLSNIISPYTIVDILENLNKIGIDVVTKLGQQKDRTIQSNENIYIAPSILDEYMDQRMGDKRIEYAYSIIHDDTVIKKCLEHELQNIPGNSLHANQIGQEWFLYRSVQAGIAFRLLKLHQENLDDHDGQRMRKFNSERYKNTYYDLSYLTMLFYADGLITRESVLESTTNEMGFILHILFKKEQIKEKVYRFIKNEEITSIEPI